MTKQYVYVVYRIYYGHDEVSILSVHDTKAGAEGAAESWRDAEVEEHEVVA